MTSVVHVVLLAVLGLAMPMPWAQAVIACLAFVLYVSGVFRLGRVHGLENAWAASVAALGVISGMAITQLANGLETGLAMAAVTWWMVMFRDATPKRTWHYALLGIVPFIRPELGALSIFASVRAAWCLRGEEGPDQRDRNHCDNPDPNRLNPGLITLRFLYSF